MDGGGVDDLPDFLSETKGTRVLETEKGKKVSLMRIFEHYEVRSLDTDRTANLLGIEESDVRKGINYWRSDTEVYSGLEDKVSDFSGENIIENAASQASTSEEQTYSGDADYQEDFETPIDAAESAFSNIIGRTETMLTPEHVETEPEDNYLTPNSEEIHIEWKDSNTELAVYAGWNEGKGPETGFASFSIDGDKGETVYAEKDQMNDIIQEMYRNAVFGLS